MQPAIGTRSDAPPAAAPGRLAPRFPTQSRRACGLIATAQAGGGIYMRGNSIYSAAAGRMAPTVGAPGTKGKVT